MKSRGMLFRSEMVRAILAGTKTQTRRILKPQPRYTSAPRGSHEERAMLRDSRFDVDDEIWVKETWTRDGRGGTMPDGQGAVYYLADMPDPPPWKGYWKPSVMMPRAASRITLKVTDVRVQRLHEITDEDARAEGVLPPSIDMGSRSEYDSSDWTWVDGYANLWESINGRGSWGANPWVFAYAFERVSNG